MQGTIKALMTHNIEFWNNEMGTYPNLDMILLLIYWGQISEKSHKWSKHGSNQIRTLGFSPAKFQPNTQLDSNFISKRVLIKHVQIGPNSVASKAAFSEALLICLA